MPARDHRPPILPAALVSLSLISPPALAAGPSAATDATQRSGYPELLSEARAAIHEFNTGKPSARAHLEASLGSFERFSVVLARDREGRGVLREVQISLARALLADEARDAAVAVIDRLILQELDEHQAPEDFGPSVRALYDERLAALHASGSGSIIFHCFISPCDTIIENTLVPEVAAPLYFGRYQIRVVATGDASADVAEHHEVIELTQDQRIHVVMFGESGPPPPSPPRVRFVDESVEAALIERRRTHAKRLRVAGGVLLGLGAASLLVYAGGHIGRYSSGFVLDDRREITPDPILAGVYGDSGRVAFAGLTAAAFLVPIGLGVTITGVVLNPDRKRAQASLAPSPSLVTLRF